MRTSENHENAFVLTHSHCFVTAAKQFPEVLASFFVRRNSHWPRLVTCDCIQNGNHSTKDRLPTLFLQKSPKRTSVNFGVYGCYDMGFIFQNKG